MAQNGGQPVSAAAVVSAAEPVGVEPSGRRVILWLFVGLAIATFLTLMLFAQTVDQPFRPRIYASMVADLMAPVIAWQGFRVIERRKARRDANH